MGLFVEGVFSKEVCHCEPVLTLAWPFPGIPSGHNPFSKAFPWGGAPRSELKSNNCRWQLLHSVKVARRSRDG